MVHPARLSRPILCNYRNDGECDAPQYCSAGDYNDCGTSASSGSSGSDPCKYTNDGECDVPVYCTAGDFADCARCPSACKCEPGSAANGGLTLGSTGMCEAHCSKEFGGKRYCGSGAGYMDGDFIDCTGCGTGSGALTAAPIDPCACTTNGNSGGRTVSAIGCKDHFNKNDIWCYTTGGQSCASAAASQVQPSPAWPQCTPGTTPPDGPPPPPPAAPPPPPVADPCGCVTQAAPLSGGVLINEGKYAGCADHLADGGTWCYVKAGVGCSSATPSSVAGAAWKDCDPPAGAPFFFSSAARDTPTANAEGFVPDFETIRTTAIRRGLSDASVRSDRPEPSSAVGVRRDIRKKKRSALGRRSHQSACQPAATERIVDPTQPGVQQGGR